MLNRLNEGIKPSAELISWAKDEYETLDKSKHDISAIDIVIARAQQGQEISKSLVAEAMTQYELVTIPARSAIDVILEAAISRGIKIDKSDKNVRELVAFVLHNR
jgi:alpha-D-ribose 1-methylphosphonate 5-triphosphate synthase subunit PhnL